jgi:glycosyltransferase involved in cell wall biosynthesis/Flp pilus assembly protein TadD
MTARDGPDARPNESADPPKSQSTGWSLPRGLFGRGGAANSAEPSAPPGGGEHGAPDPVSAAVAKGRATGRTDQPPRDILDAAERSGRIADAGNAGGDAIGRKLSVLLDHIANYPGSVRLQILAARLIDGSKNANEAPAVWQGIAERFPDQAEPLRMQLRWTARLADHDAARAILDRRFPVRPSEAGDVFLYARACDELKIYGEADWAFEQVLRLEPSREEPVLAYAKSLEVRGQLERAAGVLDRVESQVGLRDSVVRARAKINLDRHFVSALQPSAAPAFDHAGNAVLRQMLDMIGARRTGLDTGHRSFVGSILMLNGSLGTGGAERQLTNTAVGLQSAIASGRKLYGRDIIGPVTVCVRSLTSRQGADFFRPTLQRAGVATMEYSGLEVYGGNRRQSLAREVEDMVRFLPPQMAEGIERLTDLIAGLRPDVVHIWQDGMILAASLSALLAGVPRIVLSVRTVPPVDRPSRMKPQYEVLYPALLALPGVILSANSHFAARRYADWLGVDPSTIPFVHNGLQRLPEEGDATSAGLLAAFDARTAGHDFTVGAVMRFDENKRPYAWLDCAAAMLAQAPQARFILVGDGPLLVTAQQYAEVLGIASRVLFAGQSNRVGFWLRQFDAFVLLSKFEGLPNVLIEAQFAGVPVVSTPAGGASETVLQGETGLILPGGDTVDPRAVADVLMTVRSNRHLRPAFAAAAANWAQSNFSVDQMLERTVRIYTQ